MDTSLTASNPAAAPLASWLCEMLEASGMTHQQLASRIAYHRTSVSRALSGREVPSQALTLAIALACGGREEEARRRWRDADSARCELDGKRAAGWPPAEMYDHATFCQALRDLIALRGLSHRGLERRDRSGSLRRSTVGAVLRGDRTASLTFIRAVLEVCEIDSEAAAAWETAWHSAARPERIARHERKVEGLRIARHQHRVELYRMWRRGHPDYAYASGRGA
jgi:hypothetical protein